MSREDFPGGGAKDGVVVNDNESLSLTGTDPSDTTPQPAFPAEVLGLERLETVRPVCPAADTGKMAGKMARNMDGTVLMITEVYVRVPPPLG
ncbi:MAG TPA: hypothetical protein VGG48_04760 [Rhizomicrobium sp.]|jgi:hypothetical protein